MPSSDAIDEAVAISMDLARSAHFSNRRQKLINALLVGAFRPTEIDIDVFMMQTNYPRLFQRSLMAAVMVAKQEQVSAAIREQLDAWREFKTSRSLS